MYPKCNNIIHTFEINIRSVIGFERLLLILLRQFHTMVTIQKKELNSRELF